MERDWKPANGKTVEKPVLTLWPKTPEDHELIDRVLKALDLRDDPTVCVACQGACLSSKGTACFPCRGTGFKHSTSLEILGTSMVHEMKSRCQCGSKHFVFERRTDEGSVFACFQCKKLYKSVKGVFVDLIDAAFGKSTVLKKEAPKPAPPKPVAKPVAKRPIIVVPRKKP